MWIHIEKIAKERGLPEAPLASHAMRNPSRYNVIIDSKGPKVESTLVDRLVADFRGMLAATQTRGDRQ
ncbi:MAG: hypothetical protein PHY45_10445 [Rhodocyclaceae bacterium]|nr:hypothetical protein [Rhodocyclaceae bacterium]